jgi:hypothetical protein
MGFPTKALLSAMAQAGVQRFADRPEHAISTGIAQGTDGGRVGVYGSSESNAGVWGDSNTGPGVYAASSSGSGFVAYSATGLAADFWGDIQVSGDIKLTHGDCAEEFDVFDSEAIEPGTVMVLGPDGVLSPSSRPYDTRVAGVVCGAGSYRPGIVLDRQPLRPNRLPIALLGKVYCKVDASFDSIEVGDLLTTSETRGYAMRASDPYKAFGALIGKALGACLGGQALIPILVTLQ